MKIRSPRFVRCMAVLFAWTMRALFKTVKVRFDAHSDTSPFVKSNSQLYLYAVWHDSAVMAIFCSPYRRMAALTSLHRDGDFVAKVVENVGIMPVRGSTGRCGDRALREMIRITQERHVVVSPDGPRGPRRRISRGIVFLASRTGRPIVPTQFIAENPWIIRGSWTDLRIPKPFSKVVARTSKPILVPPGLSRDDLDIYVARLQQAMDELHAIGPIRPPQAKAA